MRNIFIIFLIFLIGCIQLEIFYSIPFSMNINRELPSFPCGNIAGREVSIIDYPNNVRLIESESQLRSSAQVSPYSEIITYGNEINRRIDINYPNTGDQSLIITFTKNVPQDGICSHNIKLRFEQITTTTSTTSTTTTSTTTIPTTTTTLTPPPIINESDGIIIFIMAIAVLIVLVAV